MAKTYETVVIDGQKYTREIDTNEQATVRRFMVSDAAQNRIGFRLDSYAARVEQGNKGPMGSAMQARNHKNGLSSNQRRALQARQGQARENRKAKEKAKRS